MRRLAALLLAAVLVAGCPAAAASGRPPAGTVRAARGVDVATSRTRGGGKDAERRTEAVRGEPDALVDAADRDLAGTVAARATPGTVPAGGRATGVPGTAGTAGSAGREPELRAAVGLGASIAPPSLDAWLRHGGAAPRPTRQAEARRELLRAARSALRDALLAARGLDVGTGGELADSLARVSPPLTEAETLAAARATLERLGLVAPAPDREVTRAALHDVAVLPAFSWDVQARWRHPGGGDDGAAVEGEGAGDEEGDGEGAVGEWSVGVGALDAGLFPTKDSGEDASGRITITSSVEDFDSEDGAETKGGRAGREGRAGRGEREGRGEAGTLSKKSLGGEVLTYEGGARGGEEASSSSRAQERQAEEAIESESASRSELRKRLREQRRRQQAAGGRRASRAKGGDGSRAPSAPPAPPAPLGTFTQLLGTFRTLANLYGADESDPWQVPPAALMLMESAEGSVGYWASDDPTPRDVLQARPPEVWLYALHTPKYGGDRMLNHFLEHYTRLGIAVERMVVVVNWGGESEREEEAKRERGTAGGADGGGRATTAGGADGGRRATTAGGADGGRRATTAGGAGAGGDATTAGGAGAGGDATTAGAGGSRTRAAPGVETQTASASSSQSELESASSSEPSSASSSTFPRSSASPALRASLAVLESWGIDYSMWYGQYSSEAHLARRLRALRRVPVRDWIVLADSDELVDFGGRTAPAALADADAEGATFVAGRLVDRVARGGKLEVIGVPEATSAGWGSEPGGGGEGSGARGAEGAAERGAGFLEDPARRADEARAAAAGVGAVRAGDASGAGSVSAIAASMGASGDGGASGAGSSPASSDPAASRSARGRSTTPFAQFPLACDVGGLLAGASRSKIVAHRGFLRAGAGSHGVILPEHAAEYFAASAPGRRSPRHGYYGASDLFHLTPYAAYWQFYASPSISGNAFLWRAAQASRHARVLHFKWHDGVRGSARDRLRHYRGDDARRGADEAGGGSGSRGSAGAKGSVTVASTASNASAPAALPRFQHWVESQRIVSQVVDRRRVPVWDDRLRCRLDGNPVRFPLSVAGHRAVERGWRAFWAAKEAEGRSEEERVRDEVRARPI